MAFTKTNITKALLIIFLVVCVFFPGDPYHIKLLAFFLMLLINVNYIIEMLKEKQYYLFYGVIFPIVLIVQSFLISHNLGASISGAYPAALILILLIVQKHNIKYDKYLLITVTGAVILTDMIALLDTMGIVNVNSIWFMQTAFYDYGMGLMGKSPTYSFYYKIFLKSSPLILLVVNESIKNKKKIIAILAVIAMFISGTRANAFLCSILVIYILGFNYDFKKIKKKKVIITLVFLLGLLLLLPFIQDYVDSIMSTKGAVASDKVRDGQLQSFFEIYSDPFNLLFGTGLGSSFYNYGTNSYTESAEMSYFELIRQIGLPMFIIFMLFILKPLKSNIDKTDAFAYICYLAIAFTNPLLFSSTAYLLYIFVYYREVNHENQCFNENESKPLIEVNQ